MRVQWDLNQGPLGVHVEVLFPDQPPKYGVGVSQALYEHGSHYLVGVVLSFRV